MLNRIPTHVVWRVLLTFNMAVWVAIGYGIWKAVN